MSANVILHTVGVATLICYLVSSVLFLISFFAPEGRWHRRASRLFKFGFACQSLLIIALLLAGEQLIPESRSSYYLWISWLLPAMYLLMGRKADYPVLGAFVAPSTALFLTSSTVLVHANATNTANESGVLVLAHAVPAVFAEASLVLAFVLSSVFLLQERRIKRKSVETLRTGGPSLETLERWNYRFLLLGFFGMSVSILTGSVWSLSEGRVLLMNDASQWLALVAWISLALILFARFHLRLSGKRFSHLTLLLTGFFIVSAFILLVLFGNAAHGVL